MNDKVDVLAVMDRIQRQADTYPFTPVGHVIEHNVGADCFREARAAVAELVDAAKECESLLAELEDGGAENPELATIRAALAKFGGGA